MDREKIYPIVCLEVRPYPFCGELWISLLSELFRIETKELELVSLHQSLTVFGLNAVQGNNFIQGGSLWSAVIPCEQHTAQVIS